MTNQYYTSSMDLKTLMWKLLEHVLHLRILLDLQWLRHVPCVPLAIAIVMMTAMPPMCACSSVMAPMRPAPPAPPSRPVLPAQTLSWPLTPPTPAPKLIAVGVSARFLLCLTLLC